jgi:hypothetical protein
MVRSFIFKSLLERLTKCTNQMVYATSSRNFVDEHLILRSDKRDIVDDERCRPLIGALWNCTDIMPRSLCADLDVDQGSTYAQGVRSIAKD